MREIEFRGRRKDNGEWVFGDYGRGANGSAVIKVLWPEDEMPEGENQWTIYDVIPETVGEYTGLLDKNKKRIFEGDIVRNKHVIALVDWDGAAGFCAFINGDKNNPYYHLIGAGRCNSEVIGNIHDTPELLREGAG